MTKNYISKIIANMSNIWESDGSNMSKNYPTMPTIIRKSTVIIGRK